MLLIKRALQNNGSPEPIFETDEDRTYFITTILIHEGFKTKDKSTPESTLESTPENISANIKQGITSTQIKIIKLITSNNSITQKEMAQELNLSIEAIKKNIKILKEKNILLRIGPTKKGKWIIKTDESIY